MAENSQTLAKLWFEKASHDIGIAKLLIDEKSPYTDGICFHCQQAVEKYLKGCLVFHIVNFRKTHDLIYLADMLSEKVVVPERIYTILEMLQGYAVEIRYPEEMELPGNEEAQEAYDGTLEVQVYCRGVVD